MQASGFWVGVLAGAAVTGLLMVGAHGAATIRVANPVDAQLPTHCPDASTRAANERAAEAFFIPSSTPDQLYGLMDPDYRQHNPIFKRFGQVNRLHGREEFRALMSARQQRSRTFGRSSAPPVGGNPLYRVMSDCDMVVVLEQRFYPDPQFPGKRTGRGAR